VTSRCEFSHGLLQEAAYARILRRQRQALHSRVADRLLASSPAVADREPEVVAHHWSCAAQPDKAAVYWRAAGMRALERAAFREAAHHFRRGLEALDAVAPDPGDDPERVDLETHLAASLQAGHGYAAAGVREAYARARHGCERRHDQERLVSVIRGEWMYHLLRADYGTALALGDEMLARGRDGGHPGSLAEGHLYRGLVHMYLGNFEVARAHLQEAFDRYHRPDHPDRIFEALGDTGVGALAYLALVLWNLGVTDESTQRSDLSLRRARESSGAMTRAQAWGMRAILHLTRGEPAELGEWLERTRAHSDTFNIDYWATVAHLMQGWQRGRSGDLAGGIATVQDKLAAYEQSGSRLSLPHFHILLADLRLAAGDRAGALEAIGLGEAHITATGERFSESELQRVKGRMLMAGDTPDPEAAAAAYEEAVAVARRQNARLLELRAAAQLLVHQRRTGSPLSVQERLAGLCAWFGADCALPDVARARRLLTEEPALRLAQRGYAVTVYECKTVAGGNLGSRTVAPGVALDIYPHMYLNWYRNFWRLIDDVAAGGREALFSPFSTVRQLKPGAFPRFDALTNMYSPRSILRNLFAGFGYGVMDLLAERLQPTVRLSDMSVRGFYNARPYMTDRAIAAMESFITRVWAVPSYLASAQDFQEYLRYSVADPTPSFWLPRGAAARQIIGPLVAALEATGRVDLQLGTRIAGVSCRDGRVTSVDVERSRFDQRSGSWVGVRGSRRTQPVDELILAVPAGTLQQLIRTGGRDGGSIVQAAPEVSGVARLHSQQVPLLHLYFRRKLAQIPAEPVGLFGSDLSLAFTDISQTWEGVPEFAAQSVLAVSASDPSGLPGISDHDDAFTLIVDLARYLVFDPGAAWGESADIDWERTRYNTNADAQLFINQTGTDEWRPRVATRSLANLALAGDFCHSHIGMTTVESAVVTGLQAAREVVRRRRWGAPVEVLRPPVSRLADAAAVYLRAAGAPYAGGAMMWSRAGDVVDGARALVARLG
jgi:predicted ATPase